jgi:hypothetical protein
MNRLQKKPHLFALFMGIFFMLQHPAWAEDKTVPSEMLPYDTLLGDWQRTDGNYRIMTSNIQADGGVQAQYFNPKPIHVEHAEITTQKNLLQLFIQLQDKGYEGSTYTLYYYAKKDALAGFYYQAPTDKTYEVVFMRKKF